MSKTDCKGCVVTNLPKGFVSKKVVETTTVGYMFLSGQKYPVKRMHKPAGRGVEMQVDTNCLKVEFVSLNVLDRVLHVLGN